MDTLFPSALAIGGIRVVPATVLAPMAGVTDTVFRRFIRNLGGCGLIMTEFTSSHGVKASGGKFKKKTTRTFKYLNFSAGRASHFGATVRGRSGRDGGRGAHLPGSGIRHPRYQFRMPGEQGHQVQRRLGLPARSGAGRTDSHQGPGGDFDSLHHEVSRRLERPRAGRGRHGAARRELRTAGGGAASANPGAGLQRARRLAADRGSEGGGEDSGDRQRRHPDAGGRDAHGQGNGLRRGHDRARGVVESRGSSGRSRSIGRRAATSIRPNRIGTP